MGAVGTYMMTRSGQPLERDLPRQQESGISFIEAENGFWGVGPQQRCWHITRAVTGWRLEFLDPEDEVATYAGTHATLDVAKREAMGRRRS